MKGPYMHPCLRDRTVDVPRAVLFDFFGTLTRAVHPAQRDWAQRQAACVLGCRPARYLSVMDSSFYQRAAGQFGSVEETLRWTAKQAGANPCRSQIAAAAWVRRRMTRTNARLRRDALLVLARLRADGARIAVVTDCTAELAECWADLPVARYVDVPVFSVALGVCKPDPYMYNTACDALGVPPEDCLYVGDGGSAELSGARRLGIPAVRISAPDHRQHLVYNPEPDWDGPVIGSLTELLVEPALYRRN